MKAKIIGFSLLTISEILIIYLIFFDNYFPKWKTIRPWGILEGMEYDRLQLAHDCLLFILLLSITIISIIGGLLLIISSNLFKTTIKIWGISILLIPSIIGLLCVLNIIKGQSLSDILAIYSLEFFISFPIFLLLWIFVPLFNNNNNNNSISKKK